MGKTLILGNNRNAKWLQVFPNAEIREINNFAINREDEIAHFVESLPTNLDSVIIDSDSVPSTDLALNIALRIRLDIHNLKQTSLSRIIIVSNSSFETFSGYGVGSVLLMTSGIYVSTGEEASLIIENNNIITPSEYVEGFLNLIKIVPNEKIEGRHSIANEWGADILAKMVSGGIKNDVIKIKSSASLYFRYCRIASLNASDVEVILEDKPLEHYGKELKAKEIFNYLLIDDEAEKGWRKVLELMMPNATPRVYWEKAKDYDSLPEDLKEEIKSCKFDIIFLDLRMLGIEEDRRHLKPEEFSGYKILRSIKKINPGIQVIMLTATNKGWNVKSLLDAGANGYYMKESPDYHFSLSYSYQNAEILLDTIKTCLQSVFLKDIWLKKEKALKNLETYEDLGDLYQAIKANWGSAFILMNQHHYKDALLQLVMAIEAYTNKYIKENITGDFLNAYVYSKNINFNFEVGEDETSCICDEKGSYYQPHIGRFNRFQNGTKRHTIDVSLVEKGNFPNESYTLSLPIKIAAVMDQHLGSMDGIKQICELVFIRNNRLAHHGTGNEYIENKRPVTKEDCQFLFDITFKLIMA